MNKVQYGLKNVHWASITEGENGAITYGTPKPWAGAVSIALSPTGDVNTFNADNVKYFVAVGNNGYEGDFESARVPEDFLTEIMGFVKDTNGVIAEYSDIQPKEFALLFQFEGDVNATKHIMYNCKCTRPNVEGKTTEEGIEVQTMSTTITASPRVKDSLIKAYCEDTEGAKYADWFRAVVEPTARA